MRESGRLYLDINTCELEMCLTGKIIKFKRSENETGVKLRDWLHNRRLRLVVEDELVEVGERQRIRVAEYYWEKEEEVETLRIPLCNIDYLHRLEGVLSTKYELKLDTKIEEDIEEDYIKIIMTRVREEEAIENIKIDAFNNYRKMSIILNASFNHREGFFIDNLEIERKCRNSSKTAIETFGRKVNNILIKYANNSGIRDIGEIEIETDENTETITIEADGYKGNKAKLESIIVYNNECNIGKVEFRNIAFKGKYFYEISGAGSIGEEIFTNCDYLKDEGYPYIEDKINFANYIKLKGMKAISINGSIAKVIEQLSEKIVNRVNVDNYLEAHKVIERADKLGVKTLVIVNNKQE